MLHLEVDDRDACIAHRTEKPLRRGGGGGGDSADIDPGARANMPLGDPKSFCISITRSAVRLRSSATGSGRSSSVSIAFDDTTTPAEHQRWHRTPEPPKTAAGHACLPAWPGSGALPTVPRLNVHPGAKAPPVACPERLPRVPKGETVDIPKVHVRFD